MMDTCKDCLYYHMVTCRRNAPQAITMGPLDRPYQSRNTTYAIAAWPMVHEDDWCGEFKRTDAAPQPAKEGK